MIRVFFNGWSSLAMCQVFLEKLGSAEEFISLPLHQVILTIVNNGLDWLRFDTHSGHFLFLFFITVFMLNGMKIRNRFHPYKGH